MSSFGRIDRRFRRGIFRIVRIKNAGRFLRQIIFGLLVMVHYGTLRAQESAGHTVTIRVIRPNALTLASADPSTHAPATNRFVPPESKSDEGSLRLQWNTDLVPKKIIISQEAIAVPMLFKCVRDSISAKHRPVPTPSTNFEFTTSPTHATESLHIQYKSGIQKGAKDQQTNQVVFFTMLDS